MSSVKMARRCRVIAAVVVSLVAIVSNSVVHCSEDNPQFVLPPEGIQQQNVSLPSPPKLIPITQPISNPAQEQFHVLSNAQVLHPPEENHTVQGNPGHVRNPHRIPFNSHPPPTPNVDAEPQWIPFNVDRHGIPVNAEAHGISLNTEPSMGPMNEEPHGIPFNAEPHMIPFNVDQSGIPINAEPHGIPFNTAPRGIPLNAVNHFVEFVPLDYENGQLPQFLPPHHKREAAAAGVQPTPQFAERRSSTPSREVFYKRTNSTFKNMISSLQAKVSRMLPRMPWKGRQPKGPPPTPVAQKLTSEIPKNKDTVAQTSFKDPRAVQGKPGVKQSPADDRSFKAAFNTVAKYFQTHSLIPSRGKQDSGHALSAEESGMEEGHRGRPRKHRGRHHGKKRPNRRRRPRHQHYHGAHSQKHPKVSKWWPRPKFFRWKGFSSNDYEHAPPRKERHKFKHYDEDEDEPEDDEPSQRHREPERPRKRPWFFDGSHEKEQDYEHFHHKEHKEHSPDSYYWKESKGYDDFYSPSKRRPMKFHKVFDYDHGSIDGDRPPRPPKFKHSSISSIIKDDDIKIPKIIINHLHNIPPTSATNPAGIIAGAGAGPVHQQPMMHPGAGQPMMHPGAGQPMMNYNRPSFQQYPDEFFGPGGMKRPMDFPDPFTAAHAEHAAKAVPPFMHGFGGPPQHHMGSHGGPPPHHPMSHGGPHPMSSHDGPPQHLPANHGGPPPHPMNLHDGPPQHHPASHGGPPPHPMNLHDGPPQHHPISHGGSPPHPMNSYDGPPRHHQTRSHSGPPPHYMKSYDGPPQHQMKSYDGPPQHQMKSYDGPPQHHMNSYDGPPQHHPLASHSGPQNNPFTSHSGPHGPPPHMSSHPSGPSSVQSSPVGNSVGDHFSQNMPPHFENKPPSRHFDEPHFGPESSGPYSGSVSHSGPDFLKSATPIPVSNTNGNDHFPRPLPGYSSNYNDGHGQGHEHFPPSGPPQNHDGGYYDGPPPRHQHQHHGPPIPDASPYPSTNEPNDVSHYIPPFTPVPVNDHPPTQGTPSSREAFFQMGPASNQDSRKFEHTMMKSLSHNFDVSAKSSPLIAIPNQMPQAVKNVFDLGVPDREHYKRKQQQQMNRQNHINVIPSSNPIIALVKNPPRSSPPRPNPQKPVESHEQNYSTLPDNFREFRPDPSHDKLPSLTYDSFERESRNYNVKAPFNPKSFMKAIFNRLPHGRFLDTTTEKKKSKPKMNRAHSKFTPFDAVSKSSEDNNESRRRTRKSHKMPQSIQDIIDSDSNKSEIVALPSEMNDNEDNQEPHGVRTARDDDDIIMGRRIKSGEEETSNEIQTLKMPFHIEPHHLGGDLNSFIVPVGAEIRMGEVVHDKKRKKK